MSFLGIGFLVGLLGIILPLAIHFFGKRRKVIQPWGAMRFLDEAKPSWKRRTLRLQDLLVLLARIAAVALLAFAFARPILRVPLPPENVHELLMIVDRSPSTELGSDSGDQLSDVIFRHTVKVLEQLPVETRVRLFVNGSGSALQELAPASGKPFNEPGNQPAWLRAMKEKRPAADTLDWADAIRDVQRRSDFPTPLSCHVVIIADAAKHGWPTSSDGESKVPEVWTELAGKSDETTFFLVPVGFDHPDRGLANLCVDRLDTDQPRIQTGKPITLRAKISNRGTKTSSATMALWLESAQNTKIAETSIPALEPGTAHEVVLKKVFPEAGSMAVQLEIEAKHDALQKDNIGSIVIQVIDRIPVAVFIDIPPDQIDDPNSRFAAWTFAAAAGHPDSIAFGDHAAPAVPGRGGDSDPFFDLQWLTPDQLAEIDLKRFAVVVWSVATGPSLPETLRSFVADGGGLWLQPPFEVDSKHFNEAIFPHEYGLSPAGISSAQRVAGKSDAVAIGLRPLPADSQDKFAKAAFSSLDELQVKRHLAFLDPVPESSRVLMAFEGGSPFVIRRQLGKGEVILTAVDSNPSSGNLASCVGYVPFVREMLWQLASSHAPQRNFTAGDRIAVGAGGELNAPGLYWIESPGDSRLQPISLVGNPEESEILPISRMDLDRLERIDGIEILDPDRRADLENFKALFVRSGILDSGTENYEVKEIWAWLLVGLLGFLILEVLLAHHLLSRRRSSMPVAR